MIRTNTSKAFFFALFMTCLVIHTQAQNPFLPAWEKGDTLEYFITESDLVESERINLETYTVRFYIKEVNLQRSIIEGHLYIPTPSNRGPHWETFFKQLQDVPFTYFMQNGVSNTFKTAVQLEATMSALDRILLNLVEKENIQPIDYAEISQWINQLKPRTELPSILAGYFAPLNKVFDQYGQVLYPVGKIPFTDLIKDCADSSIAINWLIEGDVKFKGPDTMFLTKQLLTAPANDQKNFQLLANCEKLEGLEAILQIDGYSNVQSEEWTILLNHGKIMSYKYDKVITMRFQEMVTSRTKQTRIILLR